MYKYFINILEFENDQSYFYNVYALVTVVEQCAM